MTQIKANWNGIRGYHDYRLVENDVVKRLDKWVKEKQNKKEEA